MKSRQTIGAFSLTELLVSISIFSVVSAGILAGTVQIVKNVAKSRELVTTRSEMANFAQASYVFANKSLDVYFYDTGSSAEVDYLNNYASFPWGDPLWDTLFFVKDSAGSTGSMRYDPSNKTIMWYSSTGSAGEVILENVYRYDYHNDSNPGTAPIFKFPHRLNLFHTPSRPLFFLIQLRRLVSEPNSIDPDPRTIPLKIMLQVNTIN